MGKMENNSCSKLAFLFRCLKMADIILCNPTIWHFEGDWRSYTFASTFCSAPGKCSLSVFPWPSSCSLCLSSQEGKHFLCSCLEATVYIPNACCRVCFSEMAKTTDIQIYICFVFQLWYRDMNASVQHKLFILNRSPVARSEASMSHIRSYHCFLFCTVRKPIVRVYVLNQCKASPLLCGYTSCCFKMQHQENVHVQHTKTNKLIMQGSVH